MQPHIVNVVLKYKLLGAIDTSNLKKQVRFSGYTVQDGKKTARVYESGNIIVTGVKSISDGDRFIKEKFPNNQVSERCVKNMTASGKLPYGISPFKLLNWHQNNLNISPFSHESEIYPAVYWKREPETVYFFMSGSVIITGLKSLDRLDPVWEHLIKDIDNVMSTK